METLFVLQAHKEVSHSWLFFSFGGHWEQHNLDSLEFPLLIARRVHYQLSNVQCINLAKLSYKRRHTSDGLLC